MDGSVAYTTPDLILCAIAALGTGPDASSADCASPHAAEAPRHATAAARDPAVAPQDPTGFSMVGIAG